MTLIDYQDTANKAVLPDFTASVDSRQVITVTDSEGETLSYLPAPDDNEKYIEEIVVHMCDALVKCVDCPKE